MEHLSGNKHMFSLPFVFHKTMIILNSYKDKDIKRRKQSKLHFLSAETSLQCNVHRDDHLKFCIPPKVTKTWSLKYFDKSNKSAS